MAEFIIMYAHSLAPLGGLAVNMAVQLLACRAGRTISVLQSIYLGFLGGGLALMPVELLYFLAVRPAATDFWAQVIVNAVTYAALGYCYFSFIGLGETARRVRIVRELYDSKTGLSLEALLQRYNARGIVEARLGRLVHNRQVVLKDGQYFLGHSVFLLMAKGIVMMKLILLGKRSELD